VILAKKKKKRVGSRRKRDRQQMALPMVRTMVVYGTEKAFSLNTIRGWKSLKNIRLYGNKTREPTLHELLFLSIMLSRKFSWHVRDP
jgi:hypothetical protein